MPRRAKFVDTDFGGIDHGQSTRSADRGIYISADGQRRQEELLNVSHKKRRLEPQQLDDTYGEWVPVPEEGYEVTDDLDSQSNPFNNVGPMPESPRLRKRKDYASSDDPMSLWRPLMDRFGDELLRHAGLGDDLDDPGGGGGTQTRLFKCSDCGQHLQCRECCLSRHELMPLHVIKEWGGEFWVDRSLADIGLVYQLGHGGFPCIFPDERVHKLTVIEAPVIHRIHVRYCKCEKSDHADNLAQLLRNAWYPTMVTDPGTCATFKSLEAYRLYNIVGNMNVNDFIHAMERATDVTASTGLRWLPDRYKQFQRMARQWAFLQRLIRAGRGHDPEGIAKTELGEAAVRCWPCPQDGKNLPPDWRNVDPKYRFLYMLLLAVDANFKLKNRMRTNEIDDPSLGPGWGYWVEPKRYRQHLKKYVAEKDASTCIAFAALLQKDTRLTMGLHVSGVGGCVCARHECVLPNGRGDLQKGERYSNMYFIILSALAGFSLLMLTISCDIACQWKTRLAERNAKMPKEMRLQLDKFTYQCALPVWHAASHNDECQENNSLSFKPGVGKTDGEGVEQVWSIMNPVAYHTKDAGCGQRADVVEDKIDSHNFQKNLGQGETLQRKLIVAIAERERQVTGFKQISATVKSEVRGEWKKMIAAWLADPSAPNPYTVTRKDCPSEAEVRLEVKRDEDAALAAGRSPLSGSSATAFLTAGLQIEVAQAELAGTALLTADRQSKLHDWRRAVLVKIGMFRDLQKRFMPGAAWAIEEAERERDAEAAPPKPETISLFMPSGMPQSEDPLRSCVKGLLEMEARLRAGQCDNAMVQLRSRLHAKRHLIFFRNDNIHGQVHATKARTLIDQIGERIEESAEKYRVARRALIALRGVEAEAAYPELKPADVRLDGDDGESDAAARGKLAMIGAGRGARAPRNAPGTSRRLMSWIWTAPGASDDAEERLHELEWTRALARKVRWEEEVLKLREEMRCVLRMLAYLSLWWKGWAELRAADLAPEEAAGLRAYALKKADWHARLRVFWEGKWNMLALVAFRDASDNRGVQKRSAEGVEEDME
ncbi:hypothetical protein DFH07DRAFT_870169 [Mycena maculata]|uniref:CxC2-like cysteine cluster KDZ transposase-associated domain-containing protein n=1 Tax=Mycena maculata TaxID=230809 RepID=A0AAD7IH22_9AGAR|nr:hypothetical protein DFH07DRAFT_870169 [Mycena maculata]